MTTRLIQGEEEFPASDDPLSNPFAYRIYKFSMEQIEGENLHSIVHNSISVGRGASGGG